MREPWFMMDHNGGKKNQERKKKEKDAQGRGHGPVLNYHPRI
jgi:hypothetical protein